MDGAGSLMVLRHRRVWCLGLNQHCPNLLCRRVWLRGSPAKTPANDDLTGSLSGVRGAGPPFLGRLAGRGPLILHTTHFPGAADCALPGVDPVRRLGMVDKCSRLEAPGSFLDTDNSPGVPVTRVAGQGSSMIGQDTTGMHDLRTDKRKGGQDACHFGSQLSFHIERFITIPMIESL